MPRIIIDTDRCKGCGLCVQVCPRENLKPSDQLTARGVRPVEACDEENCTGCKLCVLMCPDIAITMYREVSKEAKST